MATALPNVLVVLGPTASGKTSLGVRLAARYGGEVVSADSRQVYRGLDIGAGKDLGEYVVDGRAVPYHLIDIVDLDQEFNLFEYQRRCFATIEGLWARDVLPVLVGGTGLYLESVLQGYRLVEAPEDAAMRAELAALDDARLAERLRSLNPRQHNTTDLQDRARTVRAIEIATYSRDHPPAPAPDIRPIVLGTHWPREELRARIWRRLEERLDAGMIEEVRGLLDGGVSPEKLSFLGLEYRYVWDYLRGEIGARVELVQRLGAAIYQFARRQESWFRRMERRGTQIHWIDRGDWSAAVNVADPSFASRTGQLDS